MSYRKGVFYERELLHFLESKGFAVTRIPSSGAIAPIDLIAMRHGLIICFEIKAWLKKPQLSKRKLEDFRNWCEKAGAIGFLAWRARAKWLFLRLDDAYNGRYEDEKWVEMEKFLDVFG